MGFLSLFLVLVQRAELAPHPGDPLQRLAEIEIEPDGAATASYVADFEGLLSVWAASEALDPHLWVKAEGQQSREDEDSGGGTTAWLELEVAPGMALAIEVLAREGRAGAGELHLVAAPETAAIRALVAAAGTELAAIERLRAAAALDEARVRLEALVQRLLAAGDVATSRRIGEALWEAGVAARGISSLDAAKRAMAGVVAARARFLPPDHPDLLWAKLELAWGCRGTGELGKALALTEEVHAARERHLAPGHPDLVAAKANLAAIRGQLGDFEGSLALSEEVLAAMERFLPPENPDLLGTKLNLAMQRKALGDLEGALALEESVHAAWERLLPGAHPDLLLAKQNLALSCKALGDVGRALELEEHVLAARQALLPADHPDLLRAKLNLAATRHQTGDAAGAAMLSLEVAQALPSGLERALVASPREGRVLAQRAIEQIAEVRYFAAGSPGLERASLEMLETARYVAGAPFFARLAGLGGEDAAPIRAALAEAEDELERLVTSGPELPDVPAGDASELAEDDPAASRAAARDAWRETLQTAALRRDRAQKELLARIGGGSLKRITAHDVAQALEPGQVAVGITKLDHWRWSEDRGQLGTEGPHYFAQVLLPDAEPRPVDLGPAKELEAKLDAWRRAIGAPIERQEAPAGSRTEGGPAEGDLARGVGALVAESSGEAEAGRALRRALVDPLLGAAGAPEPGTTIHLCLDDALFTVPLDALPLEADAQADERTGPDVARLGDRYPIRCELSMARLIQPDEGPGGPVSVLAVGDVDFDAVLEGRELGDAGPRARLSGRGEWPRLAATAAEVAELADQAQRHLGVEARVLREDEVTQQTLAEASRGKRYVHLATHGWFLPQSERKSILDEERGSAGGLLDSRATVTGFAPLTLCGLVLSGASAAGSDAERSARLLTAQELASFDLAQCDLAVLSACETNVGIARAGQGIQSLQTALHMAGARASVTSLWAVNDWPTQSLMQRFYDYLWAEGLGKADALWEAKRALRRGGEPPYAWAGWVLAGDPN